MRDIASRLDRTLGSFKFRLAAYFLLLALLPLLGAVWAFSEVATEGETRRADARLNAALRVAVADFSNRVDRAEVNAESLARATSFEQPLGEAGRAELEELYAQVPNSALYVRGQRLVGSPPPEPAVRRVANVTDAPGNRLGRVVVSVPLDADLVSDLRSRPGFAAEDVLALVADGRMVAGPAALADAPVPLERAADVELDGETYRVLTTRLATGATETRLVVFTPKSAIGAAAAELRLRMLLFAAVALLFAAAVAYFLGRTIVRSLKELADAASAVARGNFSSRVPARGRDEFGALGRAFNDMAAHLESRLEELSWERARARGAVARFGEALAATHNRLLLVPVVVETIVEATGAAGGRFLVRGDEIARAGDPDRPGEPLEISLAEGDSDAGVLLLTPREGGFSDDARDLARWLASQALTALEQATLHKRLEIEAVTDGLTELPNRRQFEQSLLIELSRLERYGGTLAVVLADLDDFKQVNDRYGHLAGDEVLRAFADVLRETVREIDTAARYGGEEFTLLLPGTDLEGAAHVAERIRADMAARVVEILPGTRITVTASFGVAAYPHARTEDALFAAADEALYRAKHAGKNRVDVAAGAAPPFTPEAVRREA
jgi:diguanylate cyclase (GGDEF)-like protein